MMASSSSKNSSEKGYYDFTANMPEDAHELVTRKSFHEHLLGKIFRYQSIILSSYGVYNHFISPMGIHPDYPFAHLYRIEIAHFPEEVLCFLWYLCSIFTIGITFDISWLYQYINAQFTNRQENKECLETFLSWFAPLHVWSGKLRKSAKATGLPFKRLKGQGGPNPFFNPHTIYFFHRPVQVNNKSGKIHALPTLIHHKDFQRGLRPDFNINDIKLYEDFQTHAFRLNNARQSFAIPFTPNWSYYPIDYQMTLDEDLQWFMEKQRLMLDAPKPIKQEPPEPPAQECPPEYFQDAQLPDDSMNIDEIGKMFNIEINEESPAVPEDDFEIPEEEEYECPDDHYGCCDKHIIEFEIDH